RTRTFRDVADDPRANAACSLNPLSGGTAPDVSGFDFQPVARIFGRALARDMSGRSPWRPPVDFAAAGEEIGAAYATYLMTNEHDDVLMALMRVGNGET